MYIYIYYRVGGADVPTKKHTTNHKAINSYVRPFGLPQIHETLFE